MCSILTLINIPVMIDLISYRCLPWCNHIDHFFVSYHFIYLMAQSVPHWWDMFFTQQTSCLPHVFLIYSSWYIGIYTVDTLLYSLCFTNCIIPFLPLLSIHPQVFTWVLQPELLLKVVTPVALTMATVMFMPSFWYLKILASDFNYSKPRSFMNASSVTIDLIAHRCLP